MFFKTDADRAAAEAAKARQDAAEAGSTAAIGARNLGAAVVATLAEVTAPADDRKGKKHAQKARAKAIKAAQKDRADASKAATKAAKHGRKAAHLGRSAADHRAEEAGSLLAGLAEAAKEQAGSTAGKTAAAAAGAAGTAKVAASHLADNAREQAVHARESLVERSGPLGDSAKELGSTAKEKAGLGAALVAALAASARERAEKTRTKAVAGVDHGIDAAVPRAQEGVAGVAPRVDHLRDVINEELLPKIQAMLGDLQVGKDRLLAQDEGVVAAVTGAPKAHQKRKGGTLIALGLLAAVGAGVAWWLSQKQKAPATDPWASQVGDDPWASRTPTSADPLDAAPVVPVAGVAGVAPLADVAPVADAEPLGRHSTGVDPVADVEPEAVAPVAKHTSDADRPLGSIDTSEAGSLPRMLESEQIDALATDEPTPVEEQTAGESPTEEIEAARHHADEAGTDGPRL
ncbi:hypothetical protein ACI3ET_04540 [Ornithinimicrobium sp. LYQ121]|uniref:hypothetical protein n=1 Tax=Ornithinimicrobium sp. LYQ121 TaxID=3378801 RepID=UPI0038523693